MSPEEAHRPAEPPAEPSATPRAAEPSAPPAVLCAKHQVPLVPGKIDMTYQGHTFPVDTLCCPVCGLALIPEDLAKGQMLRVEQNLEEK